MLIEGERCKRIYDWSSYLCFWHDGSSSYLKSRCWLQNYL